MTTPTSPANYYLKQCDPTTGLPGEVLPDVVRMEHSGVYASGESTLIVTYPRDGIRCPPVPDVRPNAAVTGPVGAQPLEVAVFCSDVEIPNGRFWLEQASRGANPDLITFRGENLISKLRHVTPWVGNSDLERIYSGVSLGTIENTWRGEFLAYWDAAKFSPQPPRRWSRPSSGGATNDYVGVALPAVTDKFQRGATMLDLWQRQVDAGRVTWKGEGREIRAYTNGYGRNLTGIPTYEGAQWTVTAQERNVGERVDLYSYLSSTPPPDFGSIDAIYQKRFNSPAVTPNLTGEARERHEPRTAEGTVQYLNRKRPDFMPRETVTVAPTPAPPPESRWVPYITHLPGDQVQMEFDPPWNATLPTHKLWELGQIAFAVGDDHQLATCDMVFRPLADVVEYRVRPMTGRTDQSQAVRGMLRGQYRPYT